MKTLSELRKEKNMTQKELAKALNLSVSAIAMYEIGKRTPCLKKALEIAGFFGVPIESIDFFSGKRSYTRAKNKPTKQNTEVKTENTA